MKKLQRFTMVLLWVAGILPVAAQPSKQSVNFRAPMHLANFSVHDFTTKAAIQHAVLKNQAGYELGATNEKGSLSLNLPARSTEFYSMQAEGYNPMNFRLNEADKNTGHYEVFLPSEELGYEHAGLTYQVPPANDTKPDMVKVYVRQDPSTYEKKTMQGGEISFSVQVAASSFPISEKKARQEWEGLGKVYIQKENGMYKLRIGPFATQQEAKKILLEVKAKGRNDAFIVVQQSGEFDAPSVAEISKEMEQMAPVPVEEVSRAPVTEQHDQSSAGEAEYKIRVASYLHPGTFNPNEIDKLGPLESYRKGEWTIMMIGGFRTIAEAKNAKNIVVSKGFKDAAIVVEKDGILETIQE